MVHGSRLLVDGVYNEVWQGIVLTILIIALQMAFSKWWLRKYRFGPLEWLWRTLTYGKIQPFKRGEN